jgi:parallel beta-helix repeat protein
MIRNSARALTLCLLFMLTQIGGAEAANCTPGSGCDCGDTITTTGSLSGDPVTTAICPGDGLLIDGTDINVDLSGYTIRGSGGGTGIKILGTARNVVVHNADVTGFATGVGGTLICTTTEARDCRITDMTVIGNGVGIDLAGSHATIDTVNAIENAGDGIRVTGSFNRVVDHAVATRNIGNGIVIAGDSGLVEDSQALGNIGDGIHVQGDANTVLNNDAFGNSSHGIAATGNRNLVRKNDAGDKSKGNFLDGIRIIGGGNVIRENRVYANLQHGIEVSGGTAASANVLLKNTVGDRGRGNAKNGIFVHTDTGNGTPNAVEIEGNVVKSSGQSGIVVKTSPADTAVATTIGDVSATSTTVVIGVNPTTLGFTSSGLAVLGGVDTFAYSNVNQFAFTGVLAIDHAFPAGTEVTQLPAGGQNQTTGHELKSNQSGGSGDLRNALCQYDVEPGNFNSRSNKANGVVITPDVDGAPFPTGCL